MWVIYGSRNGTHNLIHEILIPSAPVTLLLICEIIFITSACFRVEMKNKEDTTIFSRNAI